MSKGRVNGKVAIVTGGSAGIGRAAAFMLAKEGAKVAVVDIDDKAGQDVVSGIQAGGGTASFWHMDVSRSGEIKTVFSEIYNTFHKINVLVNNAGIHGIARPSHEIKPRIITHKKLV